MKLVKPIKAHGETVTELEFREPTGEDWVRDGFPFKYEQNRGGSSYRVMDMAAVSRLISSLAGIPPSSVKMLCTLDWTRAMGEVISFLADPDMETIPTD